MSPADTPRRGPERPASRPRPDTVPDPPGPGEARAGAVDASGCGPGWLGLRESADAPARAGELVGLMRARWGQVSGSAEGVVIRDLGCGTGSMGRWLAGRLPGPQRWILQDRDPDLLARARVTGPDADGGDVTVTTQRVDVTGLDARDLSGTSLVTASALLDLLSADEVDGLAAACVAAGCPALLTLSVVGRVELSPPDPLDAEVTAAFNAHQRRTTRGRRLLGPDAAGVTAEAFRRRGAVVHGRPSPWRLGAGQAAVTAAWLRGWVGAAREQRPELAARAEVYLRRRLEECAAGVLRVVVGHRDLLALPPAWANPAGV